MKSTTTTTTTTTTSKIEIFNLISKDDLLEALSNNNIEYDARISSIVENLPVYGMQINYSEIKEE